MRNASVFLLVGARGFARRQLARERGASARATWSRCRQSACGRFACLLISSTEPAGRDACRYSQLRDPESLERGDQMTKFALDLGFSGDRFRHMRAQAFAEAPTHAMQRDVEKPVRSCQARAAT